MVFGVGSVEVRNLKLENFKARSQESGAGLTWEVEGAEAVMQGSVVNLKGARLKMLLEDGSLAVVRSDECRFDEKHKTLRSSHPVRVEHPSFVLEGTGYTAYGGQQRIVIHKDVRMVIDSSATGGVSIFRPAGAVDGDGGKEGRDD
jgi:LPS export ABC transporter protein LptC